MVPTEKELTKKLRDVWMAQANRSQAAGFEDCWRKQAQYVRRLMKQNAADSYLKGKIS